MPARRKKLHKFNLDEISGVDRGAQKGAKVVLMKREDVVKAAFSDALDEMKVQDSVRDGLEDLWTLESALRRSLEVILQDDSITDKQAAVRDSLAEFVPAVESLVTEAVGEAEEDLAAEKAETPMKTEGGKKFPASDFAYVPDPKKPSTWKLRLTATPGGDPDPRIVGAAVAALGPGFRGQKVQIPADDKSAVIVRVRTAWKKANPDADADAMPEVLKKQEERGMNKDQNKDQNKDVDVTKLQEQLDEVTKRAERSELILKLSSEERAHFDTLEGDEADSFLKMEASNRESIIEKARAEDPVVYTSQDGMEFRKSDDPRLVAFAKQRDADRKRADEAEARQLTVELTKRAEDELENLPGSVGAKVEILKALESIKDQKTRDEVKALLKAGNDAAAEAFLRKGTSEGDDEDTPSGKLNKLAKKHAEEKGVSFEKAYAAVLETEEGRKLYREQAEPSK